MVWKYRFGIERYIKQINDNWEWQKKRLNSVIQRKKVMSEIYLWNACKLDREANFLDFYVQSIAFRIKIIFNITRNLNWEILTKNLVTFKRS